MSKTKDWIIDEMNAYGEGVPLSASSESDVVVSARCGDRGQVSDIHGNNVDHCIEANLTTGRCAVYRVDANGMKVKNQAGTDAEIDVVFCDSPLRFERA